MPVRHCPLFEWTLVLLLRTYVHATKRMTNARCKKGRGARYSSERGRGTATCNPRRRASCHRVGWCRFVDTPQRRHRGRRTTRFDHLLFCYPRRAEFERRALRDPALIAVDYEFIVAAGRDPVLAAEVNAHEHSQSSMLGEALERLGAAQSFDAARIVTSVVRGYELERMTRPRSTEGDLRRRLERVVPALATQAPIHPLKRRRP